MHLRITCFCLTGKCTIRREAGRFGGKFRRKYRGKFTSDFVGVFTDLPGCW